MQMYTFSLLMVTVIKTEHDCSEYLIIPVIRRDGTLVTAKMIS